MIKEVIKKRVRRLRKEQTFAESLLWERLRNRKFQGIKFLRQHPIVFYIDGKEQFFIADFYCHQYRLIIEVDGSIHNIQKEYDRMRSNVLKEMGFVVVRFSNEEVETEIGAVLECVQKYFT